jgi:hypothetical protein
VASDIQARQADHNRAHHDPTQFSETVDAAAEARHSSAKGVCKALLQNNDPKAGKKRWKKPKSA